MRTAKNLIRLGGCPGCSESSLGEHAILLVLSRGGSYVLSLDASKVTKTRLSVLRYRLPRFLLFILGKGQIQRVADF